MAKKAPAPTETKMTYEELEEYASKLEEENDALREQVAVRGLQPEAATPPRIEPRVEQPHGLLAPTDGASGRTAVLPAEDPKRPGPPRT